MNKKTLIIILLLLITTYLFGQANIDSLWSVWNNPSQPDTSRYIAMHSIAWDGYLFSQPDSGFYFAQLGYEFAKSKGLRKQMTRALNIQGVSFWIKGDYESAVEYFTRSLTIYKEIENKKGVTNSLNNIGNIYYGQGDYAKTIENYTQSLTILEEIGDKSGIALSLNNIANIYVEQELYDSSIYYFNLAETEAKLEHRNDFPHSMAYRAHRNNQRW